jgi:hypothetical protein
LRRVTSLPDDADNQCSGTTTMRNFPSLPRDQQGRVGYILLWLLGVPIPVLFLIYLLRGCT